MRRLPARMRRLPARMCHLPARMRRLPARMNLNSCFMFYACTSLQNMQKCMAIHFCFPFIEGKCLFLTLH
jgi:hypothetical protein